MVSNCAWAIAAWATGEMSSRSMKRQRSSRRARTCFAGGPTYSALLGSVPPYKYGTPKYFSASATTSPPVTPVVPLGVDADVDTPSPELATSIDDMLANADSNSLP